MQGQASQSSASAGPDVVVVGGGPGGYVAAIRAAQLGKRVLVIEKAHLGGICANWGCIPTKALLHSAELYSGLKKGAQLGVVADGLRFDYPAAIAHSRKVAENQKRGVGLLFKKNQIEHLDKTATLRRESGKLKLFVDGKELVAPHIILAVGAKPKTIPGLSPDGKDILTYFEAMNLPSQPKSLLVVGAGAIGIEFAYFYNAIGTEVTVLEALPQILPIEDSEVAEQLKRELSKQGIRIHVGARFAGCEKAGGQQKVRFTDASGQTQEVIVDKVLSAVGVTGNLDSVGAPSVGVKIDRGFLAVDEWYRLLDQNGKPEPGFYAIGDCIGGPLLAHKASAEGICCVEKIAGLPEREIRRVDLSSMPGATFCRPEVGSMGLTEQKARSDGRKVKIGKFPFKASGKAQATGETEGFVKVVLDDNTGEILGAHILGGTASDMISALCLARGGELTATEVLHTVLPHPTYGEIIKGAFEAAFGEAIDL